MYANNTNMVGRNTQSIPVQPTRYTAINQIHIQALTVVTVTSDYLVFVLYLWLDCQ